MVANPDKDGNIPQTLEDMDAGDSLHSALPEKFRGKSVEDVVRSYQDLEKFQGRQAQELGQLRQLTDQFLKRQLETGANPPPANTPEKEVDFYDDPEAAVDHRVRKILAEVLPAVTAELGDVRRDRALSKVAEKHGDWQAVVFSPDFQNWLEESPTRKRLYDDAQFKFDSDAALELLGNFKAHKGYTEDVRQDAGVADIAARKSKQRQDATLEIGGAGESPQKIYRRADLIRLKMTDPERYEALQNEIMAAYASGRVR